MNDFFCRNVTLTAMQLYKNEGVLSKMIKPNSSMHNDTDTLQ